MGRVRVVAIRWAESRAKGVGRGSRGGRKMTHASDSEPSLISAAERSEARFIKLVWLIV